MPDDASLTVLFTVNLKPGIVLTASKVSTSGPSAIVFELLGGGSGANAMISTEAATALLLMSQHPGKVAS